jgi:hypothetical protein
MDGSEPVSLWTSHSPPQRHRAMRLCWSCPLLRPCQAYAIEDFPLKTENDPDFRIVVGGLREVDIRAARRGEPRFIDRPPTLNEVAVRRGDRWAHRHVAP